MNDLAQAIAQVARGMSGAHVSALASAYRGVGTYSNGRAAKVRSAVPAPHHDVVDRLNKAWKAASSVDGPAIAVALEVAQAACHASNAPAVQVVVTGPDSPAAPVRLTSEVVLQLIDAATERVTLVSFAAYQMPAVIAALDSAVARGVSVNLILESPEHLDGRGGAAAYAKYHMYHWPIDRRDPPDAKLHAKAVLVDGRDVLLTSANLTNAAYDKNIELGVLCRGGGIASQIQSHFDGLIARGILQPVP